MAATWPGLEAMLKLAVRARSLEGISGLRATREFAALPQTAPQPAQLLRQAAEEIHQVCVSQSAGQRSLALNRAIGIVHRIESIGKLSGSEETLLVTVCNHWMGLLMRVAGEVGRSGPPYK